MTAIIISVLAALGIGGGVMLASSGGGGSSSGGAAVIGEVNPGGGNYNPADSNSIPMVNSTISVGGYNSGIKTGAILAAHPATTTLASRVSSASLNNGRLTMELNLYAPTLVEGTTNTYTVNETFSTASNGNKFLSGYKATNPPVSVTFNLIGNPTQPEGTLMAYYASTNTPSKNLPELQFTYTGPTGEVSLGTFTNVTWELKSASLVLGGSIAGLTNSDFGFVNWDSEFTHSGLNAHAHQKGVQTLYIFDSAKKLSPEDYTRYTNNTANFAGNIIGKNNYVASCGGMLNGENTLVYGNIDITLNFASKSLSGSLSNMKSFNNLAGMQQILNKLNSMTFTGRINTDSSKPNFEITTVSGGVFPLNSDDTFGQGVVVKGSNVANDEVVGDLSFAYYVNGLLDFLNLSFGAKKQSL